MNKILTLLLAFVVALTATAQGNLSDNQRLVGHTVTDDIDIKGAVVGVPGTYTIGATLDSGILSAYKGCKVVGIRIAAAVDLGRTRVFLNSLSGSSMNQLEAKTQRIYEDWNEVFFNGEGYTITGDETLFYGFDYVETKEMLDADKGGIASTGTDEDGAFMIYINNMLAPVSQVGKLCVQLIVDVTNLPGDNMLISFFDTGFKYKKRGDDIEVFALINNTGREAVTSFTIGCRFDDGQPEYIGVNDVSVISGGQTTWQHVFEMPSQLGIGSHTMTVWVEKVNGTTLGMTAANSVVTKFGTYDNSMQRNGVYLEVYNDQNSVYSSLLNPVISDLGSDTYVVNVHAPSTSLAVDNSAYLFDLYAYTTPAFTVNRSYFPGEKNVAYDMNDFLAVLDRPFLVGIVEDIVAQDKTTVSFAGLRLATSYNADTRTLSVTATGDVLPEAEAIYGKLALTLMLVEDNVSAPQKIVNALNQTTVNGKYVHNKVLRGYITAPCGDAVKIADNKFSATFTTTVPADFNIDNLSVTGILTKAADSEAAINAANMRDYDVINVASATIDSNSGLTSVAGDADATVEAYYNLQGMRVPADALTPGVYIRRYTDGHTDKTMIR